MVFSTQEHGDWNVKTLTWTFNRDADSTKPSTAFFGGITIHLEKTKIKNTSKSDENKWENLKTARTQSQQVSWWNLHNLESVPSENF